MIKLIQTLIMMYRTNIKKYLVCFTTFWRGKLNNQKYSVRISSNSNLPESDWRTVFSDKVNFPTWLWLEVRILWKEQRINKCINWTRIIYHMQRWTIRDKCLIYMYISHNSFVKRHMNIHSNQIFYKWLEHELANIAWNLSSYFQDWENFHFNFYSLNRNYTVFVNESDI